MPPSDKIPGNNSGNKGNLAFPQFPYCGFSRCWKHGKYWRKGFHRPQAEPLQELVAVQRYLCRGSPCDRTFSELPEGVLPYCRFFLSALFSIADDWTEGRSSYWIAKYRWGLSLRVILRTVSLIRKMIPWLEGFCRETAGSVGNGFQLLAKTIREKVPLFSTDLQEF